MSGGKNAEFLKDPFEFLKNNLLVVKIQDLAIAAGVAAPKFRDGAIVTVDIQKTSDYLAQKPGGGGIPVCKAVCAGQASKRSSQFRAYYLPFFNNRACLTRLQPPMDDSIPPKIYLTDEMTGCAFATGAGPLPQVGHFNFTVGGDEAAAIDDAETYRQISRAFGGGTKSRLLKADYKRDATDHVTLIGVQEGMDWAFYWQRFSQVGWGAGGGGVQKPRYQIDAAPQRA